MHKPGNHTNSALGNPLLKSFNNYRNTNGRYSCQEHSKNWHSSQKGAKLMGRRDKTAKKIPQQLKNAAKGNW